MMYGRCVRSNEHANDGEGLWMGTFSLSLSDYLFVITYPLLSHPLNCSLFESDRFYSLKVFSNSTPAQCPAMLSRSLVPPQLTELFHVNIVSSTE